MWIGSCIHCLVNGYEGNGSSGNFDFFNFDMLMKL